MQRLRRFGVSLVFLNSTPLTAFSLVTGTKSQFNGYSLKSKYSSISSKQMSHDDSKSLKDPKSLKQRIIRVLALHGSEGKLDHFSSKLENYNRFLQKENYNVKLEITAIQASFKKGNGFAWWNMPPGVRSFTATEKYDGFETSATDVLDVWKSKEEQQEPFDSLPPIQRIHFKWCCIS